MAMQAQWTKSGWKTSTVTASISASYANGRVTIKLACGYGSWTPHGTFRLHGSSEQEQTRDWFYNPRQMTFYHDVTQNGTYTYYVSVDPSTHYNILHVTNGVRGTLKYYGQTNSVSVTVTDRYVPKVIADANINEVSRNSRPALQITGARNTDGSQSGIQVNVNGSGWQNYSEGMTFTNYAPGSTITVQLRNSDTPGTVITKSITLSYGVKPTASVQVLSVVQNTASCLTANSNGSYSVSKTEWSIDGTHWNSIVGQSFTITGLQYNTEYTVLYKTTYTENYEAGNNALTVRATFKTPLPTIEHSINAIDTFKHVEDKSGATDTARFKLVLKDGITLQTIFMGIQEYSNYTYDADTQELLVKGLSPDTIYTITAYATNSSNEGEYASIKFQTNGKIYDALLEDPTSGNHVAPLTFTHNVYTKDFTKNQETINNEVLDRITSLEGVGGPIDAISFLTEFNTNTPTTEQLTKAFCEGVWGKGGTFTYNSTTPSQSTYVINGTTHKAVQIFSATWVRNTDTSERWVLTNTPDTDPAVFEFTNTGIDTVHVFNNTSAGIIKGSTDEGKVTANFDGTGTVNGFSTLKTKVNTIEQSLASKLDKATGNSKLYGTTSTGAQTTYDLSSLVNADRLNKTDVVLDPVTWVATTDTNYTGWYKYEAAWTVNMSVTNALPILSVYPNEETKFGGKYQASTRSTASGIVVDIYSEKQPTDDIAVTISLIGIK